MQSNGSAAPDFDVVLIGNDWGTYAYARAFHEQYGVRASLITRALTGAVDHSTLIDYLRVDPSLGVDGVLAELDRYGRAAHERGRRTILLCNSDYYVSVFTENKDMLQRWYEVAIVDRETLDLVADKVSFDDLCRDLDIPSPRTLVADFRDADAAEWNPGTFDIPFPVVAKPALSSEYELLQFPGKEKVYKVDTAQDLTEILYRVRDAGFRDRFVIQELIPGDDTTMRSITAYVDSHGEVTLMATAQVLLQEHTPLLVGNPAAMITTPYPEMMEQATRLLQRVGYHGFANFDVKVDPRDGVAKFFEVNPRIGRNNYYVTAAGANVAQFVVADLIENRRIEPVVVTREVLYSLVPQLLLRRYLDAEHRSLVARVKKSGGIHHPLDNNDSWQRTRYRVLSKINHIKKFQQHYRKASESGF